ncbi:MAG: glycosyltransferase family 2 protein [Cytophagales bacterium]|nr:MAG: glycosyltransferase family 2 protein [Cytophagales bacterium]
MNTTTNLSLSVVLITLNAERTLSQTLTSVSSLADEIVLIDSGSTDDTLTTAKTFGCRVFHRLFDGFGPQKKFAIEQATHDWVLLLDADEALDPKLQQAIRETLTHAPDSHAAFSLPRSLVFMGRPMLHGGENHRPVVRLFNRQHTHMTNALVHETLMTSGPVTSLKGTLWHDSYGSLHDYIGKMNQYTSLNARQSERVGRRPGPLDVSVRFVFKFLKVYFVKGSILDGLPGFVWAFFSAVYPVLKYTKLYEQQVGQGYSPSPAMSY